MALQKNPGPPLTSILKGAVEAIPLRWRTKLGFTKVVQEQPTDIPPTALSGLLVASAVEQERTDERKKTDVTIADPTGQTMVEYIRTKDGQVGTRTVSYVPTGTALPSFDELTVDANQDASGNGWSEQIVITVPNLFGANDYRVERPDRTPPDFGALLETTETAETVAGTAALPTLGTGELMREEQQVTEQTKRVTVRSRDIAELPKVLTSYDTDDHKEIIAIVRTWQLDSVSPDVPTATEDTKYEPLGDGTVIATISAKAVFPGPVYGKSIENLIPPKFRAHLPTKTSEITDTGTAAYRTLATGELTHQEQQIDRFNRRIKSESFDDIVGEVTFTDTELTEQFGGGVLDVTYKLNVSGTYTIDQGLLVLESSITDLGNGYEIKTTKERQGSEWPALDGQDYDERLDVVLPFEQQVVDAGTGLGDARTSIKPIDAWRQENRTIDITAIGELLDAFVLAYPSKVNVELPDVLKSVDCIMESTSGEGTQTEDGTVSPLGDYSISMSLRASAQSSATIIPDASFVIKQFWGNNIDSTNIQFFLPSPVVGSDVLTKIAAILGVSVTAWPKFSPEMVILKAVGQKLSLQVVATSQGSDSVSGTGSASTTAGGVGVSQEASLTLKTIRISPTIHDNITVGGDTTPDSVTISATANSEAVGLGPAESSSESGTVNGSLTPTSISATSGLVDWATMSGKYLMRVDAEPYRFGYIQFHCIVVDAGDFPS